MSMDPDGAARVEVRVFEQGEVVHVGLFGDLESAESFADAWTERVPAAHVEFEELAGKPLTETVQQDTALTDEYPHAG